MSSEQNRKIVSPPKVGKDHFRVFYPLWHLNGGNKAVDDLYDQRERIGGIFLDLAEPNFTAVNIDIRARVAIIVTGIYFMILNKKSLICGINLKTPEGMERIRNEISNMIEEAEQRIEKKKQ